MSRTIGQQVQYGVDTLIDNMDNYVEGSVWFYQPNTIAPPIFAALFLISGIAHMWQTSHYHSYKMTLLIPWGALCLVAGLCTREVGAFNIENLGILIASTVLCLSGPPVYAAANYFILGRTLYYIPWLSPIHPGRVVVMFIGIDFFIEILVANGAARMANTGISSVERDAGAIMVKVSLIAQACSFSLFIGLLAIWHTRVKKAGILSRNLRTVVWELYVSSALITIRCIYRIVEFFQGYTGEVYTHEVYFYVLDAGFMLVNSVLLNSFHPGRFFPQKSKVYLAKDGVTEVRGPGWRDPRKWYWQIVDPFDFRSLFTKEKHDFWNHPPISNDEGTGSEESPRNGGGRSAVVQDTEAAKVPEKAKIWWWNRIWHS